MSEDNISTLVSDFFDRDDIDLLIKDTGKILECPLMVIDDTYHVTAHYSPEGFRDEAFELAVKVGEITYEAGVLISERTERLIMSNLRTARTEEDSLLLSAAEFDSVI